jgi:hypothetical protein
MLALTLRQLLPQTLALRGAPLLGLRAFSLTAAAFETATPVKTRKTKAAPPKKIFKKDLKPPIAFPGTSWTNFVREQAKGHPGRVSDEGSAVRVAAQKWAEMSKAEKDAYAPSREEVEEYFAKKHEWKKSLPRAMRLKLKTKKPGLINAYGLFIRENYDNSISFTDNTRANQTKWSSLSEAEKLTYKERAREVTKANQEAQSD